LTRSWHTQQKCVKIIVDSNIFTSVSGLEGSKNTADLFVAGENGIHQL